MSYDLTVVMQVALYLSCWYCNSLPSRLPFQTLLSFLIPSRIFNTFALQSTTSPSQIHIRHLQTLLAIKPPESHLTLVPHTWRWWKLISSSKWLHFLFQQMIWHDTYLLRMPSIFLFLACSCSPLPYDLIYLFFLLGLVGGLLPSSYFHSHMCTWLLFPYSPFDIASGRCTLQIWVDRMCLHSVCLGLLNS